MCNCGKKIRADERYVTFKNIDCFANASAVIDNLLRILQKPENNNAFWEKFVARIPNAYYTKNPQDDPKESLLYLVCSCSSTLIEYFELLGDEDAIHALEKCEHECC